MPTLSRMTRPGTAACPECTRLLAEFERLDRAYAAAFDAVIDVSTGSVAEFARLRIAADKAWDDAERVRLELQEHKRLKKLRAQCRTKEAS